MSDVLKVMLDDLLADMRDLDSDERAAMRLLAAAMAKDPTAAPRHRRLFGRLASIVGEVDRQESAALKALERNVQAERVEGDWSEGAPTPDPNDRDLECVDPDYSPPEDGGLPRPDDAPDDD